MPTQIIYPERVFQVWQYTVSLQQLLLRSNKSLHIKGRPDVLTRIDVYFIGVESLHLPTLFTGLSIIEATEEEIKKFHVFRGPSTHKNKEVFKVQAGDFLGYVDALDVSCHEDEGNFDDQSFFPIYEPWIEMDSANTKAGTGGRPRRIM